MKNYFSFSKRDRALSTWPDKDVSNLAHILSSKDLLVVKLAKEFFLTFFFCPFGIQYQYQWSSSRQSLTSPIDIGQKSTYRASHWLFSAGIETSLCNYVIEGRGFLHNEISSANTFAQLVSGIRSKEQNSYDFPQKMCREFGTIDNSERTATAYAVSSLATHCTSTSTSTKSTRAFPSYVANGVIDIS